MEFAKRMAARPGMHLDTLLQEEERGEVTSNRPLSRPEIERKGRKEGRKGRGERSRVCANGFLDIFLSWTGCSGGQGNDDVTG